MKKFFTVLFLLLTPMLMYAQTTNEKEVLNDLLNEFLEGASYNDPETHDRFWAEDLIYTGSAGTRTTKADIMSGMPDSVDRSVEPASKYHAEDVQIQLYGDAAVVAFKLVSVTESNPSNQRMEFYNTGTFVKRDGDWKAVAWQATRIPE
ncbi:nuclear transport factor 2 family protein [Gracilimonas sp.]|uniref:nuclear transport factor 2 family protein n=1 Tax=Gracilimonas sp. TaxID=1974203 RepID=UPI00287125CD|nr:nuclear transport factor 2 family protein [Gracilimonas sp.]